MMSPVSRELKFQVQGYGDFIAPLKTMQCSQRPPQQRARMAAMVMQDQTKLEIYVAREQAERVAAAIIESARTGEVGDGIVAILPVHRVFSVRTRADTIPNRPSQATLSDKSQSERPAHIEP